MLPSYALFAPPCHGLNALRVPVRQADAGEGRRVTEHSVHSRDERRVPVRERLVEAAVVENMEAGE
jgi:hypothetical protein